MAPRPGAAPVFPPRAESEPRGPVEGSAVEPAGPGAAFQVPGGGGAIGAGTAGVGAVPVGGSGEVEESTLLARAYLSRVAEPACGPVWDLVNVLGPEEAAAAIRAERAPAPVLVATEARRHSAEPAADLDAALRHGMRLVVPESEDWPHFALAGLPRRGRPRGGRPADAEPAEFGESVPPLALWVRGPAELAPLALRSVAIVGARAATSYGQHVTSELAFGLARREVVVVSGGAFGIDLAAHRAALAAEAITVLVSAAGLDRPYPAAHRGLFEQVADTGLLVSESPPGTAPHRHRFLTRNRLVAAFGTATLVVEAALRSGAANTAAHAFRQGRPVLAVPGPITSPMSAGCHELLRREPEPALLVTSVDEVLAVVGGMGEGLGSPADIGAGPPGEQEGRPDLGDGPVGDSAGPGAARRSTGSTGSGRAAASALSVDLRAELDRLDATSRRVFDGVPAHPACRPEAIARRCGVAPLEVIRALPGLEQADLVEPSGDGGFRLAPRLRRGRR